MWLNFFDHCTLDTYYPKSKVSTTKYVTFFKKGSSHVRFIATVCCCCSFWHWKIFASVIHCCPSSFFFQVPCRCRRQIELNFVQHILSKDRNHKSRRMWAQWARKYPFLYCNPQFCKWEKERKSDFDILSLQHSYNYWINSSGFDWFQVEDMNLRKKWV